MQLLLLSRARSMLMPTPSCLSFLPFFQIADFNMSRLSDQGNSSVAAMNPRWLAPELMQGERATLPSDVFAFGVVLWEAMTWQLPWGAANPWTVSWLQPLAWREAPVGHRRLPACLPACALAPPEQGRLMIWLLTRSLRTSASPPCCSWSAW